MLNYSVIYEKAKKERIDSTIITREYWQLLFLQRLYSQKESKNIFFKGGTAIRFLLNSFRFSEDLDFTSILGQNETEKLLLVTFAFFQKNASEKVNFKKEKIWEKFAETSLRYRFLFQPENSKQFLSIKIDMSLREKPKTKQVSVITPFDYPISPYPIIVHLKPEEIFAEKIRALLIRDKSRDLFDTWFLLTKNIKLNEKLINTKLALYKDLKLKFNPKKIINRIGLFDEQEIKRDLNQFLPMEYRTFYSKLKKVTIEELQKCSN